MTAIFHDMLHWELEDYVDDIVVKSKKQEEHVQVLRKVFERCRAFKLRMNRSVLWEILGFPSSQQWNRSGPGQSYSHSNHETSSHSKGVEEFLGEGLIYLKIHPWIGINYFFFLQITQEGAKL